MLVQSEQKIFTEPKFVTYSFQEQILERVADERFEKICL